VRPDMRSQHEQLHELNVDSMTAVFITRLVAHTLSAPASIARSSRHSRVFRELMDQALGVRVGINPTVTLEKTATAYDRKHGIKWLSCIAK
jgi:hypothetical protein